MKVLLINGSPRQEGNTYTALKEASAVLEAEGIQTKIAWIGSKPVRGCTACGACARNKNYRCVFEDDICNTMIEAAEKADGYLIGSPVYYAGANGSLISLLDRMFYAAGAKFAYKPGAGVAVARRAGTTLTVDQINKYFQINNMPIISSNYWAVAHGRLEGEAAQDAEGMQTMRGLGRNMAWLLKSLEAGRKTGITCPKGEPKTMTNFIR